MPVHKFQKIQKNGGIKKDDLFPVGGHGNHPDYTERMAKKLKDAKIEAESPEDLDEKIYEIIKEARNAIKEKVVSTGETAEKVNDIIF